MIGARGRYAAEIWFGGRQAAEVWLGNRLVWSGKRVPLRVLAELGLVSRAQLFSALGAAGVSESELQLIADTLLLDAGGCAAKTQREVLEAEGLAAGQAGRKSAAGAILDKAAAEGAGALPGVLLWKDVLKIWADAEPESRAARKAEKSAKLEENAADAEFSAGHRAQKIAQLEAGMVSPEGAQGFAAAKNAGLDAETAAAEDAHGWKAGGEKRLDAGLPDAMAGAGKSAEEAVKISHTAAGAAFGQGFAGEKAAVLETPTAAGRYGEERRAEIEKALWVLYSEGRFGHGFAGEKAAVLDTWQALAAHGTQRKSQVGAALDADRGDLAGSAGVKAAAEKKTAFYTAALRRSRRFAVKMQVMLLGGAAKAQRSGGFSAKVQREGLNLAAKLKFRPEKQAQAAAKIFADAQAALLGALGRKLHIAQKAGMRAQAKIAKSERFALYAQVRTKPFALAGLIGILPKALQGAARAGILAFAGLENTKGGDLQGIVRESAATEASAAGMPGSALCGQTKTGSVLAAAKRAGMAAAASVRQTESVYAALSVEHASWTLPVVENGWLRLAQAKTAEVLNGWLVLDMVQEWELPAVQDGWVQIVQVQEAKTENGYLELR